MRVGRCLSALAFIHCFRRPGRLLLNLDLGVAFFVVLGPAHSETTRAERISTHLALLFRVGVCVSPSATSYALAPSPTRFGVCLLVVLLVEYDANLNNVKNRKKRKENGSHSMHTFRVVSPRVVFF